MPSAQGKSYVLYFKKVSPVSVSVDDIVAICDDQVTMSAVVNGNLTHRTFWWELISGPAVLWITPQDQLVVTWAPADIVRTDRLFRFYINKDDPANEEVYDVWVYATPTDQFKVATEASSIATGPGRASIVENIYYTGDNEPRATDMFTANPLGYSPRVYYVEQESVSIDPKTPKNFAGVSQSTNFYVVWNVPPVYNSATPPQRKIKEYVLESSPDGASWTVVGTYSQPQAVVAAPGLSYRVKVRFEDALTLGGLSELVTRPSDHTWNEVTSPSISPTNLSSIVGSERVFAVDDFKVESYTPPLEITNYAVAVRNLFTYDWTTFPELDDDQYEPSSTFISAHSNTITNYNVIVRNLFTYDWTSFPELDDDTHSAGGQDIRYVDKYSIITNYIVVGGGTIGG